MFCISNTKKETCRGKRVISRVENMTVNLFARWWIYYCTKSEEEPWSFSYIKLLVLNDIQSQFSMPNLSVRSEVPYLKFETYVHIVLTDLIDIRSYFIHTYYIEHSKIDSIWCFVQIASDSYKRSLIFSFCFSIIISSWIVNNITKKIIAFLIS